MEEFLRYVIGNLIENPDEILLMQSQTARKITFRLRLPQAEVGKVIGKQGRTIAALRSVLSAGAARHGQKALLQVED